MFMWQVPTARMKPDVERIQAFRYPSPGSRRGARIPIRESEDDVYNINYYSRDPRNLPKDVSFTTIFFLFSFFETNSEFFT
jgi:hypothetical protein